MFLFFLKKIFFKKASFAGLALVLLAGLAVVSCSQPANSATAHAPVFGEYDTSFFWNVFIADNINLTVNASSPDGGTLSWQWYKIDSGTNVTGGTPTGTNAATLNLAKAEYVSNGSYYFYVVVTNTISGNSGGGAKTAAAASAGFTVNVAGNPDTDYSDTYAMPSNLTGDWESEWGELYAISAGEFSSGVDWGEGWSGYRGTIVNHRGNAEGASGYITIQYAECTWDEEAEGKYYVIYYRGLTETTVTIAGAGSFTFTDPDFDASGGRATQAEAEATYTVSAGYFAMGSDLSK